ncbi:diacylglycerol kinase family protein [Spirillospora sp. NPDC048819]|uniref:diacylglycerol/lipid kinase family protein n=1 Tax=Spirillospora sp. NPDC048819 TaxID=3155268 RepID=UPI0033F65C47
MARESWAAKGLLLANPRAGARNADLIEAVARHCEGWVGDLTVVRTEYPRHAEEAAAEAAGGGADVVIAVGGDGTTREVASGLANAGPARPGTRDAALVNVPAGTGNSFYKQIWSDRPWRLALDAALSGTEPRTRRVDLARIEETGALALLGIGSGLIAEVTAEAARLTGITGRQRYWTALERVLRCTEPYPGRVTVDGVRVCEGGIQLTNIGGGRYRGGRYRLLPRSVVDDGLLDICVAAGHPDLAGLLTLARDGRHVECPEVVYAQGRTIVLERLDGRPLPLEHDGEPERSDLSRCTVSVLAGALPVLAP